jgi:lipoprotein-anchoring transpeptidase ErfK/SrfK
MRVSGQRFFSAGIAGVNASSQRFWQIAILTGACSIAFAPSADAALFYWQDNDQGYYRPMLPPQPRKQKVRRPAAKTEAARKETSAKPHGPLIIAVSLEQQKVRVYDSNGLFAESPVSTGMKGHSTPMGVFSVIQKNKMHRSNIYSGAPMPYMQRITWSGIALHAGVLPGYPASHGCIRMPTAFAVKMWNWTRMGARVIITPGAITPASFSHPLLVAQKVVPQPLIADDPKSDAPAIKGDKGADAGAVTDPMNAQASLDLRSTIGHGHTEANTADATSAMPAATGQVTMSDARPSAADANAQAPASEPIKAEAEKDETAKTDDAAAVNTETPAAEAANTEAPKVEEAKTPDIKAPDTKASDTNASDTKASEATPAAKSETVATTPAIAPDVKKDPARLPGAEKAVAAKPEAPRRPGQIAVFVSRKDSKLYVRENFKPQFSVPVTIAPDDRPLGTHVFTAEIDKSDPNLVRWSVVSMPVTARRAARIDVEERSARRKPAGGASAEAKPQLLPNSPAEALDRITIPQDAMTRIAELLITGSSIVVSDLGISQGGETGEGTDFIVPLR